MKNRIAMKLWKWEPENLPSVIHSIRTAIAATLSLAVARLFGLPEAYWAAIATLVVMQSTLGATLLLSIERIAATALGALAGALLASFFTANLLLFAAAVFVLGMIVGEGFAHNFGLASSPKGVGVHGIAAVIIGLLVCLFIGFTMRRKSA